MANQDNGQDLLQQFVGEALLLKAAGGRTGLYSQLVSELSQLRRALREPGSSAMSTVALSGLLRPLSGSVSLIRLPAHDELLREVLDISLWEADATLRQAVLDLVLHLAAAVPMAVQPCVQTLVHSLKPPPALESVIASGAPALGSPWEPDPAALETQDAIVACLLRLVALVPTAAPRALPFLVDGFPHALRDRSAHCFYVRGLLALTEAPALREAALAGVVGHLLALDVEIRWEDIVGTQTEEAREEVGGEVVEEEADMFELEGMTEAEAAVAEARARRGEETAVPGGRQSPEPRAGRGGWEAGAAIAPGTDPAELAGSRRAMGSMADKLDSLMELTLEHIAKRATEGGLSSAARTMLAVFERKILHAHRSKFVQFVVFLVAAKDASGVASERLLDVLLRTLADEGVAGLTRTAAAAYVASFLARAQFLDGARVVATLARLLGWALTYASRRALAAGRGGFPSGPPRPAFLPGGEAAEIANAPFHAAVQGALYVLCYHVDVLVGAFGGPGPRSGTGADAVEDALARRLRLGGAAATPVDQLRWVLDAALPALLACPLDPLHACARSVIVEISQRAQRLRLGALAAAVAAWEVRAGAARGARRPLEVFFPFDPYLLQRSARHLDLPHTYVSWERGRGARRAGDEEEEDDDDDDLRSAAGDSSSEEEDDEALRGEKPVGAGVDVDVSPTSSSSSSSDGEDDASDSEGDDLRRTRFGSLPSSSCPSNEPGSWDTTSGPGRGRGRGRAIPVAMRAALAAGSPISGAASPDVMMMALGGSPFPAGFSPLGSGTALFPPSVNVPVGASLSSSEAGLTPTGPAGRGFPPVAWQTLRGWQQQRHQAASDGEPVAMSCTPGA